MSSKTFLKKVVRTAQVQGILYGRLRGGTALRGGDAILGDDARTKAELPVGLPGYHEMKVRAAQDGLVINQLSPRGLC